MDHCYILIHKWIFYYDNHCLCAIYLQDLWVNFTKDQLFCLLGPNGAGKTTIINCLTGISTVTSGDGRLSSSFFGLMIYNSLG